MQTVNQLSAVGCRTLWLDHGPHPDHDQHRDQNDRHPMEDQSAGDEPAFNSGEHRFGFDEKDSASLTSRAKSAVQRSRAKAPLRPGTAGEKKTALGGGDGGDRKIPTGEGRNGEDLLNGRSSLMFLDVEEEIGAAGMVGSSEWLLR